MPLSGDTHLASLVRELLDEQRPQGAYEIARRLAERVGRPGYANTVYRIIAPMVQRGEVVAIASAKGWVLADRRWEHRLILLCEQCGLAQQTPLLDAGDALLAMCSDLSFRPHQICLELVGLCQRCDAAASATGDENARFDAGASRCAD
jgi:Fur family zinc uptake transcriptional regulator